MRFLVRFDPSAEPREHFLASVRAIAKALGSQARNPKWTSYGALEIDIFSPAKADFDLFIAAVTPIAETEFIKDLNQAPPYRTEEELLEEARELFNSERYWESHEILEGVWRQKQGQQKRLIQGIILVCAAFVHHQKGEESIGLGVLRRAIPQLEFSKPSYGRFRVKDLRSKSEDILKAQKFSNFRI